MSDQDHGKGPGGEVPDNAQDLTIFVQNLLEQMVGKIYFKLCMYITLCIEIIPRCPCCSNKGSIKCPPQLLEESMTWAAESMTWRSPSQI